jgi:hypothetical protein
MLVLPFTYHRYNLDTSQYPFANSQTKCNRTLLGGRLENGKYPTLSLFFKQALQAALNEADIKNLAYAADLTGSILTQYAQNLAFRT